ncbi:MAG: PRC-barrel domain-containing protein [Armatimonadetes bacterium]|nr:PRC-barrel domain-containing protein [Armatimonadota bacterium]
MSNDRPLVLERLSEFRQMPQELKGPDIRGREVVNPAGNVVGRVEDIFVDAATNEARFAELALSGTHGRATRDVLVEMDDMEILSDEQVRVRPVAAGVP